MYDDIMARNDSLLKIVLDISKSEISLCAYIVPLILGTSTTEPLSMSKYLKLRSRDVSTTCVPLAEKLAWWMGNVWSESV